MLPVRDEALWWFKLAVKDLERAKRAVNFNDKVSMVFWSQQAVEKALKAYALAVKKDALKTHNIRRLREFVKEDFKLPEKLWEKAYELTQYYYLSRYPDILEGLPDDIISNESAKGAVEIAEKIVNAVQKYFEKLLGREK